MRNKLTELCQTDDKGTLEPSVNVLSQLIRNILRDLEISPEQLSDKLKKFVKENAPAQRRSYKAQARRRSSYFRTVAGPSITWGMFNRGIMLFAVSGFRFGMHWWTSDDSGYIEIKSGENLRVMFDALKAARKITNDRLSLMVDQWYEQPKQQGTIATHKGRKPKGNMMRGLESPTLSWRFFVIGLDIIGVQKTTFDLFIKWENGTETIHSTDYDVRTGKTEWAD